MRCCSVRVDGPAQADGGRGLFLDCASSAVVVGGEKVLVERPLHVFHANKHETLACGRCLKHLTPPGIREGSDECIDFLTQIACMALGARSRSSICASGIVEYVDCKNRCGEVYCSVACMRLAFEEDGHDFLCTGNCVSEQDSLFRFKVHAMQCDDSFLLAAKVIASILEKAICASTSADDVSATCMRMWSLRYGALVPKETRDAGDELKDDDEDEKSNIAHRLLMEALSSHPKVRNANVDVFALFPLNAFLSLLKKFVCNNVGVRVRHPACSALLSCDLRFAEHLAASLGKLLNDEEEEPLCADDLLESPDWYFPPVDGEGLYPVLAAANHACDDPNIVLSFEADATLIVTASKDMKANEELSHDYARHARVPEERRAALAQYGITCECAKCISPPAVCATK